MKLYLGYKRQGDTVSRKIEINEKNAAFQYGYNKGIMSTNQTAKPKKGIWSDDVAEIILKREISVQNMNEIAYIKIVNKTIIDYAETYVENEQISSKMLSVLNYV